MQASYHQQLASALVSYLPPRVAASILGQANHRVVPSVALLPAAILLADISGFTALTEKLAARGSEGAEELTQLLNSYFSRMIDVLVDEGGEVVQFSGDALIAMFAYDDELLGHLVTRAAQAAHRMQAAMDEFATLQTSVGPVALGMKIAISAGDVLALSVGGERNRWQYVIAGDPLRQVAAVEKTARRGEVRFSPKALAHLSSLELPSSALPPIVLPEEITPELIDGLCTHIPGAVTYRLLAGQFENLEELRRMTLLFLGIGGLDDESNTSMGMLQEAMIELQRTVYRYESSVNKFLVDDKGTISIIAFGAPPLAHHDDPLRAVRCALEIQDLAERLGLRAAIGITSGQVFAGPVGSAKRREYTVMGDTVNLAARLMQLAGRGGIIADHATFSATRSDIGYDTLAPQTVKGRVAAVRMYRPTRYLRTRQAAGVVRRLVGRQAEMVRINNELHAALGGTTRIVALEGESGVGKTRLFLELTRRAAELGLVSLYGSGQSIDQQTPYLAWREIFASYFDLELLANASQEAQREQVLARLEEIAPQFIERAALLNDLLNLGIAETELTANLEPKLRQASLNAMLIDLLVFWAADRPLVLALEDAQWLDPLSWKLAQRVARSLSDVPLLMLLIHTPLLDLPEEHPLVAMRELPQFSQIPIGPLESRETLAVAAARLGVRDLPASLATLIEQSAAGNAFVAEELAVSLLEAEALRIEDGNCILQRDLESIALPENVQGLVLSRLDRLPVPQLRTIKTAAVIGRIFGYPTLRAAAPHEMGEDDLVIALDRLVEGDLINQLHSYSDLRSHTFKQSLTQEVAYQTLLYAQRRELHERVARWFERQPPEELPELYSLLVYHWRQAANHQRELHFAVLAARKFAAEYANSAALTYLSRALELATDDELRNELLWLRVQIYERTGERGAQADDLRRLADLAVQSANSLRPMQVANAWGAYYWEVSNYPAAMAALEEAEALALAHGDRAGHARSLTLRGNVLEYRGELQEARDYFERALAIYRTLDYQRGVANNLSSLGNLSYYLGDFQEAFRYDQEALAIRRAIGDRVGEVKSLNNLALAVRKLSTTDEARSFQQRALDVARAIGDRNGEAFSYSVLGEFDFLSGRLVDAQRNLEYAIRLFRATGDRLFEATSLNLLGQTLRDLGDRDTARTCFDKAIAILGAIGEQSYAAYSYLNLANLLEDQEELAMHCCEIALAFAREGANRDAEGYAFAYRAALHERAARWHSAEADYRVALAIREEVQAEAAAIEDHAGLARVALARDQLAYAEEQLMPIVSYLELYGIDGLEFPLKVFMTCYDLCRAKQQFADAQHWLSMAHSLLVERAAAIDDPDRRAQMLNAHAINQRVLAEWHQNEQ
jgi:class 3 adenylate cyclase/tetratricopeptide (TPR) repeat protein